MEKEKVTAFATDVGGPTSHTAIMAKALEIPAVVGLDKISEAVRTGDRLIVDELEGKIIVNPNQAEIRKYQRLRRSYVVQERSLGRLRDAPAETIDGYEIELAANLELPSEVRHIQSHGANGIGLFPQPVMW